MHEGGELGYALLHAFGAAFDNPDLIVACVIGDGEAETCPLEGSWKSVNFLNPVRDGAVLPILHLNGYKISGPTVEGRTSDEDLKALYTGRGYNPISSKATIPESCTNSWQARSTNVTTKFERFSARRVRAVQKTTCLADDRSTHAQRMDLPQRSRRYPIEGTFRSHQVPLATIRENPEHLKILENWMRSYQPELLFDEKGAFIEELAALAPTGNRRMGGILT